MKDDNGISKGLCEKTMRGHFYIEHPDKQNKSYSLSHKRTVIANFWEHFVDLFRLLSGSMGSRLFPGETAEQLPLLESRDNTRVSILSFHSSGTRMH